MFANRFGARRMAASVRSAENSVKRTSKDLETKTNPYPIVFVKWADAHCGDGGWLDLGEYEDDGECLVETVGFLVPSFEAGGKDKHVTVWQTYMDGEGINPFHIPVGMVRSITILSPGDSYQEL